jgi:hypothetical protein
MDLLHYHWTRTCMMLILLSLALPGACAAGAPAPQAADGDAGMLRGVEGFPLDHDSGNMGIHALSSCLKAVGATSGYYTLVGLSRSAFKFVYDTTEAYEPLRDLYPVDVMQQAAKAVGYPDAHWEVNRSIDTIKLLVKQEINSGRPVIAPFLKSDAYHGFFIIAGYDYGQGIFYLQGALGLDSGYVSVPVPDYWDGPTASPLGWAGNPVFILGEPRMEMERRGAAERKSVKMGMRLYRGGTLEYGEQPGERMYMSEPGPHTAHYGLPAYDVLSRDVENAPVLVERDGGEAVNFGLLWRLDSQLGQLQHDREHGATYVRGLSRYVRFEQRVLLGEVSGNFEGVAGDVLALRRMFWNPVPEWCASAEDVIRYIESEEAIVYWIPETAGAADGIAAGLESRGYVTRATPWGPVVVLDAPGKRLKAKILVKSIASREKNSLYVMKDVVDHIGRLRPDALETGGSPAEGGGQGGGDDGASGAGREPDGD